MKNDDEILVAATSAIFEFDGRKVRIIKGRDTARRGHPIVQGRAHMFVPLEVTFELEPIAEKQTRRRKTQAVEV